MTDPRRSDIVNDEQHLLAVLASDRFRRMEGLGNEVAHFIYDYKPDAEIDVARMRQRIKTRLTTETGLSLLEINLYELCVDLLKERGVWERLLDVEPTMDKKDFHRLLQNMLDPEAHLAPAIRKRVASTDFDILFLTGVGQVFPFVRSHTVLNNLQTVVSHRPMLMFFPGRYDVSNTQGSTLVLFGRLKDDSFYRAKRIRDQEA